MEFLVLQSLSPPIMQVGTRNTWVYYAIIFIMADPPPPESPVIVKEGGITRINIFKSRSEKFGPIK